MAATNSGNKPPTTSGITRVQLSDLLSEELAREYQSILANGVYSQMITEQGHPMDLATALGKEVSEATQRNYS